VSVEFVYDPPGIPTEAIDDARAIIKRLREVGLSEEDSLVLLRSA
jgi:hypothetical protein